MLQQARTKVGFGSGGLAVVVGLTWGILEVQGYRMPDFLAYVFIALLALAAVGFAIYSIPAAWTLMAGARAEWGFRWPLYSKSAPNPQQWLLDIARQDAENPARHLQICGHEILRKEFWNEAKRPWVEIGIELYNGGVHEIQFGRLEGRIMYKGQELPDPPGVADGGNKPRGHRHVYTIKQYVSEEAGLELHREAVDRREIRTLDLSGLRFQVTASLPNAMPTRMSLGSPNPLRVND